MKPSMFLNEAEIYAQYLDQTAQARMIDALREVARQAPLFKPTTRRGPMSVQMTSAGTYGWIADKSGYRYEKRHPSGVAWPEIPDMILQIWQDLADYPRPPQSCLVNFYGEGAKMGMHQDKDEADLDAPVLSISLGDEARFRIGGHDRGGSTRSVWLHSGDIVLLKGGSRLRYHGIDLVRAGSSTLLPGGGRINVTLRVVD